MASSDARKVSELLDDLANRPGPRVSLAEIVAVLGDRAFGVLMLMLALPNAVGIGGIPGVSTVFGVAGQHLEAGRDEADHAGARGGRAGASRMASGKVASTTAAVSANAQSSPIASPASPHRIGATPPATEPPV